MTTVGVQHMKKIVVSLMLLIIALNALSIRTHARDVYDYEITLLLPVGSRTGSFTGYLQNGIPQGHGIFVFISPAGEGWRYEGDFINGQFHGMGSLTSDGGRSIVGIFMPRMLNGQLRTFAWVGDIDAETLTGSGRRYVDGVLNASGSFIAGDLWDGVQYAAHGGSTNFAGGQPTSERVSLPDLLILLVIVLFFIPGIPILIWVLARRHTASKEANAQINILRGQRVNMQEPISWTCNSCGAPNHSSVICAYCSTRRK